jgi:choline dehydrogenase-like flavoprotein
VQTLGGQLAADILRGQLPEWLPQWTSGPVTRRVYGLFLQTEDGSHRDNRVIAAADRQSQPRLDYDPARTPAAEDEHRRLVRLLQSQLLRAGYLAIPKRIPVTGTAHACGTLAAGNDAADSVVGRDGRVHGLANLFVSDGSVLPRSSRVNPALTIYAWGLRVGEIIAREQQRARENDRILAA